MRKITNTLAGLRNVVSRAAATGQVEKPSQREDVDDKSTDVFRKSATAIESRPDWYQATHRSDS